MQFTHTDQHINLSSKSKVLIIYKFDDEMYLSVNEKVHQLLTLESTNEYSAKVDQKMKISIV